MESDWFRETPTESGWYWFYGKLLDYEKAASRFMMIRVSRPGPPGMEFWNYSDDGATFKPHEWGGWWQRAQPNGEPPRE